MVIKIEVVTIEFICIVGSLSGLPGRRDAHRQSVLDKLRRLRRGIVSSAGAKYRAISTCYLQLLDQFLRWARPKTYSERPRESRGCARRPPSSTDGSSRQASAVLGRRQESRDWRSLPISLSISAPHAALYSRESSFCGDCRDALMLGATPGLVLGAFPWAQVSQDQSGDQCTRCRLARRDSQFLTVPTQTARCHVLDVLMPNRARLRHGPATSTRAAYASIRTPAFVTRAKANSNSESIPRRSIAHRLLCDRK